MFNYYIEEIILKFSQLSSLKEEMEKIVQDKRIKRGVIRETFEFPEGTRISYRMKLVVLIVGA